MSGKFTTKANASWGECVPVWLKELAEAADRDGPVATAALCGFSDTTIYTVCAKKYGASTDNVERKVRAALMGERANCPVLGDIPASECQQWQLKPLVPSNRQAVRMHQACRSGCDYSQLRERTS